MKITTKQLTVAAMMLAIAIASQFLKDVSVYFTGSVINLILVITTLFCGMLCGIIIAIITPITSFIITGSPIIAAVPLILPCIMLGNIIFVLAIGLVGKVIVKLGFNVPKKGISKDVSLLVPSVIIGAILKALFMSVSIVLFVIPTFGVDLTKMMISAAKVAYSTTQLITALIGGALACVIWPVLKIATRNMTVEE